MTDDQAGSEYQTILDFWFSKEVEPKWFFGGSEFDAEIKTRFSQVHAEVSSGGKNDWLETVDGRLAAILVLDQFSRNIYRDQAAAFANDSKAVDIAWHALRCGDDLWLKANRQRTWRVFVYMPFMHSEKLDDQRWCVDLFLTHGPDDNIAYARAHHDIIRRFGRFPHRNAALQRVSTPEELEFLQREGSSFA